MNIYKAKAQSGKQLQFMKKCLMTYSNSFYVIFLLGVLLAGLNYYILAFLQAGLLAGQHG